MSNDVKNQGGSVLYVCVLASVAALGGLLFGYDTAVISGAIGFLQVHFDLDPQLWKGWAAACALIGCAVGAGAAGLLSDRLGRKRVLGLSAILFLISALGTAFPRSFSEFIIYRIIGGLGVGAASITSPMYIAEVSPAKIRGRMVSVNQFAIISGMLVVYFVNYFITAYGVSVDRPVVDRYTAEHGAAVESRVVEKLIAKYYFNVDESAVREFLVEHPEGVESRAVVDFFQEHDITISPLEVHLTDQGTVSWNEDRGWRWMFGSEVLPAALLLVLMFFVPESPRWLAKQGRREEALAILTRVGGADHAVSELAEIEGAIARESGSLAQLFQPGMRIVLVIGVTLAVLQQVTGINVFLYYAPEIFKSMGSEVDVALRQTILVGAVNLTFTVVAIWTVDRVGRKPLMLIGFTGMGLSLLAVGLAAYWHQAAWWVLVFVLTYIACFALSVGPVTWVILSEIFPTRIRGRAMAIATVLLWLANYVVTQTFTMMEKSQYLVENFNKGFPYWIYGVLCAVSVLFVWRFVPETKGKTLEQIETSWIS
ncbi:MAG TPA: sugar porter family MFS transporter [Thermoguttaceae bacterium]|nr:sugar porter family MFS transporter [Thermoguttaceae bacterium]